MLSAVRVWFVVVLGIASLTGCHATTVPEPMPANAESAFEIRRIGARVGLHERIWLDEGLLWRESRGEWGELERSGPIIMTRTRMDDLDAMLTSYAAWRWQSTYANDVIMGGVSMQVDARLHGRAVSTSMVNRGPAFSEFGELTYSNVGLGLGEDLLRELRKWFAPPQI